MIILLVCVFGFGLLLAWLGLQVHGAGRRVRLRARPQMAAVDWFKNHAPDALGYAPILAPLLKGLGECVGAEWTQLRPDDTFESTYRGGTWFGQSVDREAWSDWIEDWYTRNGPVPPAEMPATVADMLRQATRALESRDTPESIPIGPGG